MSTYSRQPKYQNEFAFKHNPNSRKTKTISEIPSTGLCGRCNDIIEWKKKYRKYKPLDRPRKCTSCHTLSVKQAYHVICASCASKKKACAKCLQEKAIYQTADAATKELREQIEFLETHKGAIPGLPERQRRAVLRELCRELSEKTGVKQRSSADEDEDEDGSPAGGNGSRAARGDDSDGDDGSDDGSDGEGGSDDEDEADDDEDDEFISEEAATLKKALAQARTRRRNAEAAERKRVRSAALSAAAAAAAGDTMPDGEEEEEEGEKEEEKVVEGRDAAGDSAEEAGPPLGSDQRPDPWVIQQRLAKMVVTPKIVLSHAAKAPAAAATEGSTDAS